MKCVGCEEEIDRKAVAAFAIMHETDLQALGVEEVLKGPGRFHAAPTCVTCYTVPTSRKRVVKAHFSLPDDRSVFIALGLAGSSSQIG